MADPLSIAASVAGLVTIAEAVFLSVVTYGKQVKHAPTEVSRLAMRISELSGVLHSLRLLVAQLSVEKANTMLKFDTIRECQELLDQIREKVAPMEAPKARNTRNGIKYAIRRLAWPFTLPETEKLVSKVEQFKSDFNFALSAENASAIFDIQISQQTIGIDLQDIKRELNRRQEIENRVRIDEKRQKIFDYYGKVSSATHDISRKLRHPETGFWFTKGKNFSGWLKSTDQNLWLYGIPGAGKTILASSLIEATFDNTKDNQATAYFYCDYRDSAKQNAVKILGSLIAQISRQSDQAFDILDGHYENVTNGGRKESDPDIDDLIPLINLLVASFNQTSIIIDGLDECGDNVADVLDAWLKVVKECSGSLRTIVLSREEQIIRRRLCNEKYQPVPIEAQTGDIRLYVASEIEKRCRTGKLYLEDPQLKAYIMDQLVQKAQGMFRWVACQLDYLGGLISDEECRRALEMLPPTLHGTYERILERVLQRPQPTQDLVTNSLRWISYATRPLSISELCEAVSIRQGDGERRPPVAQIQIFNHCSSLIRMCNDGIHVELAHFTVKEFLASINASSDPKLSQFYMTNAELQLGITSLNYLSFKDFRNRLPESGAEYNDFRARYSFYNHASTEWSWYLRDNWENTQAIELSQQLFEPQKSSNFLVWCLEYLTKVSHDISTTNDSNIWATQALQRVGNLGHTTLHWAALLGIPPLVKWLISRHVEIDQVGFCGTALHAAILGDLVFDLRVSGSKCDAILTIIPDYWTENRKRCIDLLLASGADWRIPLTLQGVIISTGELLLCTRDSSILSLEPCKVSILDKSGLQRLKSNLSLSFKTLHPEEKEFYLGLQDSVVNENCRNDFKEFMTGLRATIKMGTTSLAANSVGHLFSAASNGQADVLQMILQLPGVEIDAKEPSTGQTPLHKSLTSGSSECVNLLMEKGASIHLKDALGQNALHHCAKNFDTSFVIKFINLGLSVHEANLNGQKLSHLAAEYNNTELLKLLVSMEGGAALNIDSKDRDGYTPLHSAAFQGSDDALLLLLPHGNINEPSDSGVSVLHLALHSCNQRTIEVLIENGADIFAESDFGYNVMHYLVQNPNETTAILDMFHKRGISFHGGKDNGDTPLHIAFGIKDDLTPSRHSLIKQIIPYCNLNAVNAKGETPLHSLFWSNIHVAKKTSLSITLINAGADPKIKDKVGDSYAQLLLLKLRESDSGSIAEKNSLDLIESILRSPNVVSAFSEKIDGIRPLNLLLQRSGNLADFLVSQGIDFTLRNESGIPVSGVEMACYCDDLITLDMMLAKSKSFSRTFPPAHLLLIMASKSKKNTTVLVQRILSLGCDVNAPGHDFELALISAVQQSNTEIAKLLLEHGASPEKRGGEVVQLNWNAIHWAIYHSNLELLSAFLKLNVNWDIRTNFFNAHRNKISLDLNNAHCLHLASLYEHSNSTSFLLKHGLVDVNVRDSVGTTALHCSAWTGQLECTELLLAAGADPEAKDNYGNTPLHFITFGTGNIELALRLLDAGCRQLPDVDGKTPEMWALQKGQLELAKALRERRTQNGEENLSKSSIAKLPHAPIGSAVDLAIALESGNLKTFMRVLHFSGSNLDQFYHRCKRCSLFRAALYLSKAGIARWLLESGCSISEDLPCNIHFVGLTNVHFAMYNSGLSREVLYPLLERGHHYIWRSASITPLHIAAEHNNTLGISIFLTYFSKYPVGTGNDFTTRPNINQRRGKDMSRYPKASPKSNLAFLKLDSLFTALQLAAAKGHESAVSMLLKFGANPNAVDNAFQTALYYACKNNKVKVVRLLLNAGANPNIANVVGVSGLMAAAQMGNELMMEELFKHGADGSSLDIHDQSVLCYNLNPKIMAYLLHKGCEFGLRLEYIMCEKNAFTALPLLFNSGLNILTSELLHMAPWSTRTFRVVWKLVTTGVWRFDISELAALQLWEAAIKGKSTKMGYILDQCMQRGIDADPWGKPLLRCCSYGRLDSVKLLLRRGAIRPLPDWETISEAITHAKHHPDVQLWILVGRFTEQRKIGFCEDDNSKEQSMKPWSGIQTTAIHLIGRYAQHNESRLFYIKRIHSGNKQDMMEYCRAAAKEVASTPT